MVRGGGEDIAIWDFLRGARKISCAVPLGTRCPHSALDVLVFLQSRLGDWAARGEGNGETRGGGGRGGQCCAVVLSRFGGWHTGQCVRRLFCIFVRLCKVYVFLWFVPCCAPKM